jgi:hypothetical protein
MLYGIFGMEEKMKKVLWVVLAVFFGMAIGCSNPTGGDGLKEENLAKVVISLPVSNGNRIVGLTATKTYTNYYEAQFRKNNGSGNYTYYSASATSSDSSIEVSIPEGTYDILLLAGYENGHTLNGEPYPILLASSYKQNEVISLGAPNEINMTLATIDVDLVVNDSITVASEFNATIVVDTKNPFIVITSSNFPKIVYSYGSTTGTYYSNNITLSGNVYTANYNTFTAPLTIGTGSMKITIEQFYPFGSNSSQWSMAEYSDDDLGGYYSKTINFIEGQAMPEVIINIAWPE